MPHRIAPFINERLMYRLWGSPKWTHYLLAIISTLLLAYLRILLQPILQERIQFIFFTIPIALTALVGGFYPGLLASILSAILGNLLIAPQAYSNSSLPMPTIEQQSQTSLSIFLVWIFLCVICDVMRHEAIELRKAYRERDNTQADLDRMLDRISDEFLAVDRNHVVVHSNKAFIQMLGLDAPTVDGRAIDELCGDKYSDIVTVIDKISASKRMVATDIYLPARERWFHLRAFPDAMGLSVFMLDVTARKLADMGQERLLAQERTLRNEAEEASRLRDQFVAMTSHELRTPLSTILGWTEILLRRNTQESMKEGLAAIDRSTRMQAQLIDDLLDMTRIATGKLKLNLQVVSVGETINEVIRANLPAAAAKNLTLEEVPLDMEMFAKADPERLAQIFSNIISNAIKFTPEGGSITIQAHASSSRQIEVKISDTGEGIDPPMLKAIFQRFRQVNSSLSRKHGGLGLGLAIAKELVESHGGRIEASSAGLGCGSQFTITLPSVDFNYPKPPQPSSSQEETKPLTDMQILVVDDDEETRTILRLMLLEAGAKVTIAPSASKALELLKAFAPDIVLSDIGMPDVDGYELMRRIREIHPHICAVALTAFATAEDRLKAIDAGFDDFLAKPVDSTRLIGAIMRIMPHK